MGRPAVPGLLDSAREPRVPEPRPSGQRRPGGIPQRRARAVRRTEDRSGLGIPRHAGAGRHLGRRSPGDSHRGGIGRLGSGRRPSGGDPRCGRPLPSRVSDRQGALRVERLAQQRSRFTPRSETRVRGAPSPLRRSGGRLRHRGRRAQQASPDHRLGERERRGVGDRRRSSGSPRRPSGDGRRSWRPISREGGVCSPRPQGGSRFSTSGRVKRS